MKKVKIQLPFFIELGRLRKLLTGEGISFEPGLNCVWVYYHDDEDLFRIGWTIGQADIMLSKMTYPVS